MKKFFLFISVCGMIGSGLFIHSVELASAMTVNSEIFSHSQDEETMELHGYFAIGRMRSIVSPFSVSKNESFLTVHYLLSYNNVNVEVLDASGQCVYFATVNAVANAQLPIDISSWSEGNYNLSFTNSSGECIYGSFEISN
ncbi:MAG: DUF3244 domain-containing protein [Dysgonamonadaceae bacterium]|jgi:hypothetical protein|nr:DUF3244 domain-containing protein [Dysgonamonadaceae bacterium]